MKKHIIKIAIIALGLLIALGPQFLFSVCTVCCFDGFPKCHWSAQAEIGLGMLIAALGICLVVFSDQKTQLGLSIGIFLASIVALFIPHALIGGCDEITMVCHRIAFPILSFICILVLAASAFNVILFNKNEKEQGKFNTTT